jgi:hypothetical protein
MDRKFYFFCAHRAAIRPRVARYIFIGTESRFAVCGEKWDAVPCAKFARSWSSLDADGAAKLPAKND